MVKIFTRKLHYSPFNKQYDLILKSNDHAMAAMTAQPF